MGLWNWAQYVAINKYYFILERYTNHRCHIQQLEKHYFHGGWHPLFFTLILMLHICGSDSSAGAICLSLERVKYSISNPSKIQSRWNKSQIITNRIDLDYTRGGFQ